MPWIYQRSVNGQYPRFVDKQVVLYTYHKETQWKYSETTPGYPNVYPLPPRNFVRLIEKAELGDLKLRINQTALPPANPQMFITEQSGPIFAFTGIGNTLWYPAAPLPDLSTHVINELNEKVKNTQFETGVFLSELPETMSMLAKDANRLLKAARAVRKGQFRLAAKHLAMDSVPKGVKRGSPSTVFADNWLKYHFGYKPIVSDMVNLAKLTCESLSQDQYVFLRHSRTYSEPYRKDKAAHIPVNGPLRNGQADVNVTGVRTITVKAGYTIKVNSKVSSSLTQLGLTNPLSVAWEVLPFSFVADWFANFGQCIGHLDAWTGKSFAGGYKTTVTSVQATSTLGQMYLPAATNVTSESSHLGKISTLRIDRTVLSGPVPTRLTTDLPDSVWHFLTSASLLQKIFRS